jgi:hypothetical protein
MRPAPLALAALLCACGERQLVQPCQPISGPNESIALSAPPFAQLRREQVRLRFETFELARVPVVFALPDQRCPLVRDPDQDRLARDFAHPPGDVEVPQPDLAGEYTLHTSTLDISSFPSFDSALEVPWLVVSEPDELARPAGTLRLPWVGLPGVRVAFTANLEPPTQATVFHAAAAAEPDLIVLNGDLHAPSAPESTWSRLAHDLVPVTSRALLHVVPGDRDLANVDAYEQIFRRWFGGQGRAGATDLYSSVDLGGVRWIFLDGSDDRLASAGGIQRSWLDRELGDIAASPALREAVIVLHRGPYGLTDQVPHADLRDEFVPYLGQRGVRLVVQGAGRVFEHFEDGGVVFLTEGGGGGPLGDPDHRIDRDPVAAQARVQAFAAHGVLIVDVDPDGAMSWRRLGLDGAEQAAGALGPPPGR